MKKDNICEGKNKIKGYVDVFLDYTYGSSRRLCNNKATIFENNKWYCKKHAPSKIKEREEKAWENYIKKLNI